MRSQLDLPLNSTRFHLGLPHPAHKSETVVQFVGTIVMEKVRTRFSRFVVALAVVTATALAQPTGAAPGGIIHGDFLSQLLNKREAGWGMVLAGRSEEHTSELQSRFDLVCRLLLEKK